MKSGGRIGYKVDRWIDEAKMAISGVILATREWRFVLAFFLTFVVFGTLMNLLSGSIAGWDLFWATDLGGKIAILGNAFLANFGIGRAFMDWLVLFLITILQSVLIGLVSLVWHQRRANRKTITEAQNFNNASDAGIAAGLAILGSGCPTCGTTLLAPLIGTFISSGSYFLAGIFSGMLTIASVILALFAIKRVGRDAYIMLLDEKYRRNHGTDAKKA